MKLRLCSTVIVLGIAWPLTSCAGSGDAPSAIEAYLETRVNGDVDRLINLSCTAWESQAITEATSFESMNARLEGMSCKESDREGDYTLVTCQGKIVTTYQGEVRAWGLSDNAFRVINNDGEWRMCGYRQ